LGLKPIFSSRQAGIAKLILIVWTRGSGTAPEILFREVSAEGLLFIQEVVQLCINLFDLNLRADAPRVHIQRRRSFCVSPSCRPRRSRGLSTKRLTSTLKVKFNRNVLKIMFLWHQEIITKLILGPPINNVDVEKETQVKNTKKIKSYIHYVSFFILYKKKISFFDVAAVKFPSLERYISSIPAGYRYIFI
jgi:hypothetical protein